MFAHTTSLQHQIQVLIADDDSVVQCLSATLLHRDGHGSVTVANGQQALDLMACHDVDLLLLDVGMPVLDGMVTLARLRGAERAAPASRHQRIIMVTSHAEPGDVARLRAAGADGCIAKPIDPLCFRREVQRVLAS